MFSLNDRRKRLGSLERFFLVSSPTSYVWKPSVAAKRYNREINHVIQKTSLSQLLHSCHPLHRA
jgi:hypothetical protein